MGFRPEIEKPVRTQGMNSNPIIERMVKAWEGFEFSDTPPHRKYLNALEAVQGKGFSAHDIESFSIFMSELEHIEGFPDKAGFFLSALINSSADTVFKIHTAHIASISYIGYWNAKEIIVEGDAGYSPGNNMQGGSITVHGHAGNETGAYMLDGRISLDGDAGDFTGYKMESGSIYVNGNAGENAGILMQGGSITICKNAKAFLGEEMAGGSITVAGDAGDHIGSIMRGGEIHVNGRIGHISEGLKHGKIFRGEYLIIEK